MPEPRSISPVTGLIKVHHWITWTIFGSSAKLYEEQLPQYEGLQSAVLVACSSQPLRSGWLRLAKYQGSMLRKAGRIAPAAKPFALAATGQSWRCLAQCGARSGRQLLASLASPPTQSPQICPSDGLLQVLT